MFQSRYDLKTTSRFRQKICCVILAMPSNIKKEDISCEAADSYHLLDSGLETIEEQIISALITISPQEDKTVQFEVKLIVRQLVLFVVLDTNQKRQPNIWT